ncbi:hypothetical protein F3W83_10010 [Micrococcus luteus]|uniref:hypothetical protein n=1 Tax=Micrococcus endophyticus TaxID=455343 RepID=UPI00128B897F|nr:hypothetical protein [Micrococcus endophyticus]MCK6091262.1 hypothetical protein [Micrococcus endophyticus]MPZ03075.1 hypothetical protein [Micrococcus luteus]
MSPPSALLSSFRAWLPAMRPELDPDDTVATVETLLRLKADYLDSPSPNLWTEPLLRTLLTEVHPRKAIAAREERMLLVPQFAAFCDFLIVERLWDSSSLRPAELRRALADLEFDVVEAADDASRRSAGGNILQYGLEHGLDLSSQEGVAALMEWHNGLTHAERIELTDTGRLSAPPSRPLPIPGRGEADGRASGARHDGVAPGIPWFLPPLRPLDWDATEEAQRKAAAERAAKELPFTRAARALLSKVADGPVQVTDTQALRRKDVIDVLTALERPAGVRSMWDDPLLEAAWTALLFAGAVVVDGRRARLGSPTDLEDMDDVYQLVLFGVSAWLVGRGEVTHPEVGPDAVAALIAGLQHDSLTLPSFDAALERFPASRHPGGGTRPELRDFFHVWEALNRLHHAGLLEAEIGATPHDESTYFCTETVVFAAITASNSLHRGAEG